MATHKHLTRQELLTCYCRSNNIISDCHKSSVTTGLGCNNGIAHPGLMPSICGTHITSSLAFGDDRTSAVPLVRTMPRLGDGGPGTVGGDGAGGAAIDSLAVGVCVLRGSPQRPRRSRVAACQMMACSSLRGQRALRSRREAACWQGVLRFRAHFRCRPSPRECSQSSHNSRRVWSLSRMTTRGEILSLTPPPIAACWSGRSAWPSRAGWPTSFAPRW